MLAYLQDSRRRLSPTGGEGFHQNQGAPGPLSCWTHPQLIGRSISCLDGDGFIRCRIGLGNVVIVRKNTMPNETTECLGICFSSLETNMRLVAENQKRWVTYICAAERQSRKTMPSKPMGMVDCDIKLNINYGSPNS